MTIALNELTTRRQKMAALKKANKVRSRRADLKEGLRDGSTAPAPLIVNPPDWVRTMRVREFLMAVPKVGPRKCDQIRKACGIPDGRTIGGLSKAQRAALVAVLGGSS